MPRYLGVDPGDRRIGIAITDEEGLIVFPRATVTVEKIDEAVRAIAEHVRGTNAETVVMGLPLELDGTEGRAAKKARTMGDALARLINVPIEYWDERWTTRAAEGALIDAEVYGSKRRDAVDQTAAVFLLRSYLDAGMKREWEEELNDLEEPSGLDSVPRRRKKQKKR